MLDSMFGRGGIKCAELRWTTKKGLKRSVETGTYRRRTISGQLHALILAKRVMLKASCYLDELEYMPIEEGCIASHAGPQYLELHHDIGRDTAMDE